MKRDESAEAVTLDVIDFLADEWRDVHTRTLAADRARRYRARKSGASGACQHPRLRSHTFTDGSTIKCCPDCTKFFDNKRKEVLSRGTIPKATRGFIKLYNARLRQEGIQPSNYKKEMFVGGDVDEWLNKYNDKRKADRKAKCHASFVDVQGATPGGLIGPLLESGWFDSSIKENRCIYKQECEGDHAIPSAFTFSYRATPVDNRRGWWPNAPTPNPSQREVVAGGKEPAIVAGNFKHPEEFGVCFHDQFACRCKRCSKQNKEWLLKICKWFCC